MEKLEINELRNEIKEQLHIDIEKYKNEDVLLKFTELLLFPNYILKLLICPVIIAVIGFIIGFFILDLSIIKLIIYILFGPLLFSLKAILFGILLILRKIKKDVLHIINYSFDILKQAISDLNQIKTDTSFKNLNQSVDLLFKGIMQLVTIPMITKAVNKKLIIGSKTINYLIEKILNLLIEKLDFSKINLKESYSFSETLNSFSKIIDSYSIKLEKLISVVLKKINIPLLILLILISSILIIFLLCM